MVEAVERDALGEDVAQFSFPAMAAFVGSETIENRVIGGLLQVHIEDGIDAKSAFVHLVGAILVFQIAADFLHKIGSQRSSGRAAR